MKHTLSILVTVIAIWIIVRLLLIAAIWIAAVAICIVVFVLAGLGQLGLALAIRKGWLRG